MLERRHDLQRPWMDAEFDPLVEIGELAVELALLPSDDGPVRVSGEPLLRESIRSGLPNVAIAVYKPTHTEGGG